MEAETTDNYIPRPGDKVSWPASRKIWGRIKGQVDFIESLEKKIAVVYIPAKSDQHGEERSGHPRTRHKKSFDQLTLLERPES